MRAGVTRVVAARALRGFADGLVSVVLARHLTDLGFSPLEIGAVVTGTLVGSGLLTMAIGVAGDRLPVRTALLGATTLMVITGVGFAWVSAFWVLFAIAIVGTMNPSAGDVSVFLPTEQTYLAGRGEPGRRVHLFARYNLAGAFAGALGALTSAVVDGRAAFVVYAGTAVIIALLYCRLPGASVEHLPDAPSPSQRPRRIVVELSALFALDSAGGGFVVQSLLVLWLNQRFDLSPETTGAVFFGVGLLAAASQLVSGPLAARIGLVQAMAYTHLPANLLLVSAAFAPTAGLAIAAILGRALLSQMDVPARQALVMAVVPPAERMSAASITNVPRSLAAAATPLAAGALLARRGRPPRSQRHRLAAHHRRSGQGHLRPGAAVPVPPHRHPMINDVRAPLADVRHEAT